MKSQNDIYHGDEHITDKPKHHSVRFTEIVEYVVHVDAIDEDEAYEKAFEMLTEQRDNFEVTRHGLQLDRIYEENE